MDNIPFFIGIFTSQVVSRISEPSTVGIRRAHANLVGHFLVRHLYFLLQ